MEEILQKLSAECAGSKNVKLKAAAQEAYEFLVAQQCNPLAAMHELREKCLTALELAIDASGTRLQKYGLDGLQQLLRDNQLHSLEGVRERTEQTLPMQMLHTLHCLPDWAHQPEIQCHCITIILQLICSNAWLIHKETVTEAVELCALTYGSTPKTSVQMAAKATVSQIVSSYINALYREQAEDAAEEDFRHVFKDCTFLLKYFAEKLRTMANVESDQTPSLSLIVNGTQTLLSCQPIAIQKHEPFTTLLWQEVCPALVKLLSSPEFESSAVGDGAPPQNQGRGVSVNSGALHPIFGVPETARSIYALCSEILRLLGSLFDMRSALEALYHRVLLYPPVNKRLEALTSLKKLFSSPERLVDILLINNRCTATDEQDLRLWKIMVDCVVECSCGGELEVAAAAVRCADAVLTSINQLCTTDLTNDNNSTLSPSIVEAVVARWLALADVDIPAFDYSEVASVQRLTLPNLNLAEICVEPICSPTSDNDGAVVTVALSEAEDDMTESMRSIAARLGALDVIDDNSGAQSQLKMKLKERPGKKIPVDRRLSLDAIESASAAKLVELLFVRLREWNDIKSEIEIDEAIQVFAADFCKDFMLDQHNKIEQNRTFEITILNADAVYFTVYACLQKIWKEHVFADRTSTSAVTEEMFSRTVFESCSVVYASTFWVTSVYKKLIEKQSVSKLFAQTDAESCLWDLVEDFDGSSCGFTNAVTKLEKLTRRPFSSRYNAAVRRLCRRAVTASWSGLAASLSGLVEGLGVGADRSVSLLWKRIVKKATSTRGGRIEAQLVSSGITAAIHGLQQLVDLTNTLGLQRRSGWIFGKLVDISCPLEELRWVSDSMKQQHRSAAAIVPRFSHDRRRDWLLRVPDAYSIELILDEAMNAATFAPECWKHAVRCIEYVWELERFSFGTGRQTTTVAPTKQQRTKKSELITDAADRAAEEEDSSWLLEMPPTTITEAPPTAATVAELLEQSRFDAGNDIEQYLPLELTQMVVSLLSAKADKFFDDAASRLNLDALKQLVMCLCTCSETRQLYTSDVGSGLVERWAIMRRLGLLVAKLVRSGRPLAHLITVWTPICLHIVEMAVSSRGNSGCESTTKAIEALQECVIALINNDQTALELDGFHFNEMVVAPFQTILCLDVCNLETQDQILSIVIELVECCADRIGSGWRPLFGALKAVKSSLYEVQGGEDNCDRERLRKSALGVFDVFLRLENRGVFCLAAVDCLNCLVHYLHYEGEQPDDDDKLEMLESPELKQDNESNYLRGQVALSTDAHRLFIRLHSLLANLFNLNRLPDTHLIHRLILRQQSGSRLEAAVTVVVSGESVSALPDLYQYMCSTRHLLKPSYFLPPERLVAPITFAGEGDSDGIAMPWEEYNAYQLAVTEVWLTAMEGLVGAVVTCPRSVQSDVLSTVYQMIESFDQLPGYGFGLYCLTELLLPICQGWMRREGRCASGWRENRPSVRNFKQAVGVISELTVTYFTRHSADKRCAHLLLMSLSFFNDCVSQSSEVISRLGCSCLKHLVVSCANLFTVDHWDIVCRVLYQTTCITLYPIRLLTSYFTEGTVEYYGDNGGSVQVALRKDSNPHEATRVRSMAQQVFLLDSQRFNENIEEKPDMLSQSDRSVILVLSEKCDVNAERQPPSNVDDVYCRLPFRDVVCSLLSHQLVLQLIAKMLLGGSDLVVGGASSLLLKDVLGNPSSSSNNTSIEKSLPGNQSKLSNEQLSLLLFCLDSSFIVGHEFDLRPGLKFLLQKVFNSPVAANLYKQTVTAWTIRSLVSFEHVRRCRLQPKEMRQTVTRALQQKSVEEAPPVDASVVWLSETAVQYWRMCDELIVIERATALATYLHERACGKFDEKEPFAFLLVETRRPTTVSLRDGDERMLTASDERRPLRADDQSDDEVGTEKIYEMVSADKVNDVLAEYKRRKQRSTMPTDTFIQRQNPFVSSDDEDGVVDETLEENLKRQQAESAVKDGEARVLAWSEMAMGSLQLVLAMATEDGQRSADFRRLLPVFFDAFRRLIAGTAQMPLRQTLAELVCNLDTIYQFLEEPIP